MREGFAEMLGTTRKEIGTGKVGTGKDGTGKYGTGIKAFPYFDFT